MKKRFAHKTVRRLKNRKKMLFGICLIFFLVLRLVLIIFPDEEIVTDAGERIYWGLTWIGLPGVIIFALLWKREYMKEDKAPDAKDDTDTEGNSASC